MRKISQVWKVFCEDAERRCRMGKRHIANRQVDKCKWALCVIGAGSYREVEVPPRPTFHCRVQKYPGLIVGLSLRLAVHHFRLFPSNPLPTADKLRDQLPFEVAVMHTQVKWWQLFSFASIPKQVATNGCVCMERFTKIFLCNYWNSYNTHSNLSVDFH